MPLMTLSLQSKPLGEKTRGRTYLVHVGVKSHDDVCVCDGKLERINSALWTVVVAGSGGGGGNNVWP